MPDWDEYRHLSASAINHPRQCSIECLRSEHRPRKRDCGLTPEPATISPQAYPTDVAASLPTLKADAEPTRRPLDRPQSDRANECGPCQVKQSTSCAPERPARPDEKFP